MSSGFGIIALLIAILLPALNKARQQAMATQCLSNLRQLGLGALMYLNDNRNQYWPKDLWVQNMATGVPGAAVTRETVFSWAGQQGFISGNVTVRDCTGYWRYVNKYVVPSTQNSFNPPFPVAQCPADDIGGCFTQEGNSYSANMYPGTAALPYYTLNQINFVGNTAVVNEAASINASQIGNSGEFVIAGEDPLFQASIGYGVATFFTFFHYPGLNQWNALFADGHAAPITIPASWDTATKPTLPRGARFKGDGFNLEWTPIGAD